MHQREAVRRRDQHLGGPGLAVRVRILAGLVDVKGMMRMLDRGHTQASRREKQDHARQQRGLARAAPASDADHFHGVII
jgi:hypothetical protein